MPRAGKACLEGLGVALVRIVMKYSNMRVVRGELIRNLSRPVNRAVVDDYDFPVLESERVKYLGHSPRCNFDVLLFIKSRQDTRDAIEPGRGRHQPRYPHPLSRS